jgi:hypothetical protein
MQVEAIYDQGRLEFVYPLKLKHDQLRLVVTVPDDEIDAPANPYNLTPEELAQAQAMLATFDAIRAAPLPLDQTLPELTPKQLERIEAFELRAEDRREQGRPV